jgi:regulator of protease activity HflC (stomatin/prohibitin superfamily)
MDLEINFGAFIKFACGIIIIAFVYLSFINPYIHIWQQSMLGQAEKARAESNRQIATLEAMAKMESSKALAEAEVIRARGVASANEIIGQSLKENEAYLRYLWIQGLQTNQMQVVYVPTEANLPILEANRLK